MKNEFRWAIAPRCFLKKQRELSDLPCPVKKSGVRELCCIVLHPGCSRSMGLVPFKGLTLLRQILNLDAGVPLSVSTIQFVGARGNLDDRTPLCTTALPTGKGVQQVILQFRWTDY
jgi:hypothetical protein